MPPTVTIPLLHSSSHSSTMDQQRNTFVHSTMEYEGNDIVGGKVGNDQNCVPSSFTSLLLLSGGKSGSCKPSTTSLLEASDADDDDDVSYNIFTTKEEEQKEHPISASALTLSSFSFQTNNNCQLSLLSIMNNNNNNSTQLSDSCSRSFQKRKTTNGRENRTFVNAAFTAAACSSPCHADDFFKYEKTVSEMDLLPPAFPCRQATLERNSLQKQQTQQQQSQTHQTKKHHQADDDPSGFVNDEIPICPRRRTSINRFLSTPAY